MSILTGSMHKPAISSQVSTDPTRQELAYSTKWSPIETSLSAESTGALADVGAADSLQDLTPEQVFQSLYRKVHGKERTPDTAVLAAFHELVDTVGQEGG